MKASKVLKKARKLIRQTGHTKGVFARNKYRHEVDPINPSAVKFCAYGAIYNVLGVSINSNSTDDGREVDRVTKYLSFAMPENDWTRLVDRYNDLESTTPEDVDAWFSAAIQLAEEVGD